MSTYSGSPFPLTCALIAEGGIDPTSVRRGGFSETGYETLVRDADSGSVVTEEGRLVTEYHEWPSTVLGRRIYAQFEAESNRFATERTTT